MGISMLPTNQGTSSQGTNSRRTDEVMSRLGRSVWTTVAVAIFVLSGCSKSEPEPELEVQAIPVKPKKPAKSSTAMAAVTPAAIPTGASTATPAPTSAASSSPLEDPGAQFRTVLGGDYQVFDRQLGLLRIGTGKPQFKPAVGSTTPKIAGDTSAEPTISPALSPDDQALCARIETELQMNPLIATPIQGGSADGGWFRNLPPDGALLVGLDIAFNESNQSSRAINAVRPLYRSRRGTMLGSWIGSPGQDMQRLEAKLGYAVGGIAVSKRGNQSMIASVSLICLRVVAGGLDVDDGYQVYTKSNGATGDLQKASVADGSPVIGIHGGWSGEVGSSPIGIGLFVVPSAIPKTPLTTEEESDIVQALSELKPHSNVMYSYAPLGDVGEMFAEIPGGILVGLEVTMTSNGKSTSSVRAIYRAPDGVKRGQVHGTEQAEKIRLEAKPGYALAGLRYRIDRGEFKGFRLIFMKMAKRGLDPNDTYDSREVGPEGGIEQPPLVADGSTIVGIHGPKQSPTPGVNLVTIGFVRVSRSQWKDWDPDSYQLGRKLQ